jgi:hypothetical protein
MRRAYTHPRLLENSQQRSIYGNTRLSFAKTIYSKPEVSVASLPPNAWFL